jgi:hypothetical protein
MTRSGPHKDDPPPFEPLPDNIFSRQTHPSWHEAYACCTRLFFWAVGRQPPPGAALFCVTCAPGYSDTSSWRRPQSADETGCTKKPSAAQMSRPSRSWRRITFSPSTLWHSRQWPAHRLRFRRWFRRWNDVRPPLPILAARRASPTLNIYLFFSFDQIAITKNDRNIK